MPISSNAFGSVSIAAVIDTINILPKNERRIAFAQLKIAAPEVPWIMNFSGLIDVCQASRQGYDPMDAIREEYSDIVRDELREELRDAVIEELRNELYAEVKEEFREESGKL